MATLHYFAYGSNLSTPRLRARVPSARLLSVGYLPGHRLAFHKAGIDGSAKCDVVRTHTPSDRVYGAVFRLDAAELPRLDEAEGPRYERRDEALFTIGGEPLTAFTYKALHIDSALQPYTWYKEHVLRGALEQGLPADYIAAAIEMIPAIADPSADRHDREMAIHAGLGG